MQHVSIMKIMLLSCCNHAVLQHGCMKIAIYCNHAGTMLQHISIMQIRLLSCCNHAVLQQGHMLNCHAAKKIATNCSIFQLSKLGWFYMLQLCCNHAPKLDCKLILLHVKFSYRNHAAFILTHAA